MIIRRKAKIKAGCCSTCSHDSSLVVRIESVNKLWLRVCLCVSGRHFESRNVREYWNCEAAGKAVRKAETCGGKGARAGSLEAISDRVCFFPLLARE